MSGHAMGAEGPATAGGAPHVQPASSQADVAPSGWVGWIAFASIMVVVLGIFNIIEGIVGLFRGSYYVVAPNSILVLSLSGWSWMHLIIGVLLICAGLALVTGAMWARIVVVVLAAINAIDQLTFLSVHPVWATIVIALDVLVIWAVVVHGREAARAAAA